MTDWKTGSRATSPAEAAFVRARADAIVPPGPADLRKFDYQPAASWPAAIASRNCSTDGAGTIRPSSSR